MSNNVALALVFIRQNDNRIQLIVSCKWAFRNLSNHNFGNLLKFQNSCGCTCSFVVRILYFGITYILIITSCILLTVFHYSIHWKCTGRNFVVILPGAPGSDAGHYSTTGHLPVNTTEWIISSNVPISSIVLN